jgi:hypothetical protein
MCLILRDFVENHHPMLCWFSASTGAAIFATVTDRLAGGEVFSAWFIAVPLIAVAWLAAAAAEFSHVMRSSCDVWETMIAIAGTLMLGIAGPFMITGVSAATEGIITMASIVTHLIS